MFTRVHNLRKGKVRITYGTEGKWLRLFLCLGVLLMATTAFAVEIVAHRGASQEAPENTLAAYRLAWQQGADAIEGDFRLTKDLQIVCLHDATFERTAGRKAKPSDLTLAEIRQLDAGSWKGARFKGEPIPTFEEICRIVPAGKRFFVEVKIGPEIIPFLKQRIESSGLRPEQFVIIAFDEKVIVAAKQAMPAIKACYLYSFQKKDGKWSITQDDLISRLLQMKADGLDVHFAAQSREMVNEDLARKLREARLELHVWTVDDPALARQAGELGAASITTNRPGWLREQLAKLAGDGKGAR